MPDAVHAAMDRVKDAGAHTPVDGTPSDPEPK
jgi:hypothetical protein